MRKRALRVLIRNLLSAVAFLAVTLFEAFSPMPASASPDSGSDTVEKSAISAKRPGFDLRSPTAFQLTSTAIPIVHYNICSSVCSNRRDASKDILTYIANGTGAWGVSVNEACIADLNTIASRLGIGGRMVFSIVKTNYNNNCRGTDKRFGNIVYHRGSYLDGAGYTLSHPSSTNCAVSECRAMICVKMASFVGPLGPCSSHFVGLATQQSLAIQQANDYIYIATVFLGSTTQYLSGDFNLLWANVPQVYKTSHTLAVLGNTAFIDPPTTYPDRQLDYIWVEGTSASIGYHPPYCPNGASDHCIVHGDQFV